MIQIQIALGDPHSMSLYQSRVRVQLLGTLCCILHRSTTIWTRCPNCFSWVEIVKPLCKFWYDTNSCKCTSAAKKFSSQVFPNLRWSSLMPLMPVVSTDLLHSSAAWLQTFRQATQGPQPGRLQGGTAWRRNGFGFAFFVVYCDLCLQSRYTMVKMGEQYTYRLLMIILYTYYCYLSSCLMVIWWCSCGIFRSHF